MPTAMNTSRRTPLPCHDDTPAALPAAPSPDGRARRVAIALVAAMSIGAPPTAVADMSTADAPLAALRCTLAVETAAVGGLALQATLHNTGPRSLRLLRWGTPFEGAWLAPIVRIERDGQPLDYQGPMVKRRAPQLRDHLTLKPGQTVQAVLPLAPAWVIDTPGQYRLSAAWMWQGQVLASGPGHATTTLAPTDAVCTQVQFSRP